MPARAIDNHQDLPVILHNDQRGLLTIEDGRLDVLQLSKDGRPPKRLLTSSVRNLLRVRLASTPHQKTGHHRLDIHTLLEKGSSLRLSTMHVLVEEANMKEAPLWLETAMRAAYAGVQPFRRVLLLVNPVSGKGKARATVKEQVLPLLEAAGCIVDLKETQHRNHALEIVESMSLDYDVIATASGDGLVYEVINGLAARSDAKKAMRIPIAPIPTGSANALCINLFGVKDTFNIQLACLNLIKGAPLPIDLASVLFLPSNRRQLCFLAVALGLMVDLDIGTEHLRWMGDMRFVLGFIKGIASSKIFKCRLRLKVVEDDKVEMARKAREAARADLRILEVPLAGAKGLDKERDGDEAAKEGPSSEGAVKAEETDAEGDGDGDTESSVEHPEWTDDGPLDWVEPLQPDDTWLVIDSTTTRTASRPHITPKASADGAWRNGDGMLYMYAGLMPWVSRDLNQWPVARPGEGMIDVVIQSIVPRSTLVGAITSAETGGAYWLECQHYYKVSAFVAENLDPRAQPHFTIDGEAFEFSSYHVEVLPRAARVLSLDGRFFVSDFLKKHDQKE
ncbi:putative D-erythro-sphingosine kinase [Dioszegia hungarica]|uniref:D-erythro-sphingosine kinase n=1 Tax=Dioszegia hungarica TaxID=4972 RepID=A0AA38LT38_9TREE|nr:putative D-erythro-sphingosine kinase [Dioszegia hungarica]KAI9632026.1 putative D-erythro-sphingosine kinase [Dioszegia hungarica]